MLSSVHLTPLLKFRCLSPTQTHVVHSRMRELSPFTLAMSSDHVRVFKMLSLEISTFQLKRFFTEIVNHSVRPLDSFDQPLRSNQDPSVVFDVLVLPQLFYLLC